MPVQHTPVYVTEAERLEQENAARQVRDLPERPRTYHIVTYGCQMNAHDSEKLAGILSGMGMAEAADRREADLVIFNTCCVRDNAERRALGNVTWLKELKKDKPGLIIGVCGCMVQQPGMAEHPDHFDPRQYLTDARNGIREMVRHKIVDVLGCNGKA